MLDDELDDRSLVGLHFLDEHVLRPRNELARQKPEQIQRPLLSNGGIFRLPRSAITTVLTPGPPLAFSRTSGTAAGAVPPIRPRPTPRPFVLGLDVVVSSLVRCNPPRAERRRALFVRRLVVVAE
ncbi:MAG: hypothetical protein M3N49_05155 [Candidatus Eremiobacteraeota bacterium]|nr:hypothetical protein [Candidatus Eremiobacteraeota bacterium]